MEPLTRTIEVAGNRLVYDEYGDGRRTFVLIHGLLLSRRMHGPLALALAEQGNRVICLDLLGHGDSERPLGIHRYSMGTFADQVLGTIEGLGLDEVVVGGTSLGANVALEVAAKDSSRLRGLVVEMPVLDNALLACALAFTPLMVYLTFGAPVARGVASLARAVPRTGSRRGLRQLADIGLDWISQDPDPSAAVLQGLFFGRTAPTPQERARIEVPTLVLGHPRDPVHPFSDADQLVRDMPNATMIEADSIVELRLRPERLTGEISAFLDGCWKPRPARRAA